MTVTVNAEKLAQLPKLPIERGGHNQPATAADLKACAMELVRGVKSQALFPKWAPSGRWTDHALGVEGAVLQVCAYLGSNQGPPACEANARHTRGRCHTPRSLTQRASACGAPGGRATRARAGVSHGSGTRRASA